MEEAVITLLIGSLTIVTGTILILMAMWRRMKFREMYHRERMAMIERGMVPPPDMSDPLVWLAERKTGTIARSRMLSGGIMVIGFGLGLMLLMGIAGDAPTSAVGVGGAIVILGFSLVVIAFVQGERPERPPTFLPPSPPGSAPTPPDRES